MSPLDLFEPGERRRLRVVALLSVAAGMLGGSVMALVGQGVGRAAAGEEATRLLGVFLAAVVALALVHRRQRRAVAGLMAEVLGRVRLRIAGRLARLDLRAFETLDAARARAGLDADARLLAEAVRGLAAVLTLTGALAFMLGYFIWLSPTVFWLTVGVALIGFVMQGGALAKLARAERVAEAEERVYRRAVTGLVDGFTELKLNRRRRAAFLSGALEPAAEAVRGARTVTARWRAANLITAESQVIALSATVVLMLPLLEDGAGPLVLKAGIVALALPAAAILELPTLFHAWAALGRIHALDRELIARTPLSSPATAAAASIAVALSFEAVYFRYVDAEGRPGFAAGPLSFRVPAGRVTALTGGPGAGKTTVLKLAAGLYRPAAGAILVDGLFVDEAARRGLAAAVFPEAHAFDRLYGRRDADPARVAALLEELGLAERVGHRDGRFIHRGLSGAERSRLALAAAILADTPLCVCDALGGDQDPVFRDRLHRLLRRELCERGRTVLTVAGDDRGVSLADHVVRLDAGRVVEERDEG